MLILTFAKVSFSSKEIKLKAWWVANSQITQKCFTVKSFEKSINTNSKYERSNKSSKTILSHFAMEGTWEYPLLILKYTNIFWFALFCCSVIFFYSIFSSPFYILFLKSWKTGPWWKNPEIKVNGIQVQSFHIKGNFV